MGRCVRVEMLQEMSLASHGSAKSQDEKVWVQVLGIVEKLGGPPKVSRALEVPTGRRQVV